MRVHTMHDGFVPVVFGCARHVISAGTIARQSGSHRLAIVVARTNQSSGNSQTFGKLKTTGACKRPASSRGGERCKSTPKSITSLLSNSHCSAAYWTGAAGELHRKGNFVSFVSRAPGRRRIDREWLYPLAVAV